MRENLSMESQRRLWVAVLIGAAIGSSACTGGGPGASSGSAGAAIGASAGAASGTTGPLCVPGVSIACAGPQSCPGYQVCNQEGAGFDPCVCGTNASAGAASGAGSGTSAGSGSGASAGMATSTSGAGGGRTGATEGGADTPSEPGNDATSEPGNDATVSDSGPSDANGGCLLPNDASVGSASPVPGTYMLPSTSSFFAFEVVVPAQVTISTGFIHGPLGQPSFSMYSACDSSLAIASGSGIGAQASTVVQPGVYYVDYNGNDGLPYMTLTLDVPTSPPANTSCVTAQDIGSAPTTAQGGSSSAGTTLYYTFTTTTTGFSLGPYITSTGGTVQWSISSSCTDDGGTQNVLNAGTFSQDNTPGPCEYCGAPTGTYTLVVTIDAPGTSFGLQFTPQLAADCSGHDYCATDR